MLSTFQIFKMLLGVMIFVFILTFFLRITDMYTGVEVRGEDFETLDLFEKSVRQTYTSGNPGTFGDFDKLEFFLYEPPKIKSGLNQKTLSSNAFVILSKSEMNLMSNCSDYGWFSFCWVYAYPKALKLIFTPLENTPEDRVLVEDIVNTMPEDIEFAYCSGQDTGKGNKTEFLSHVTGTGPNSMRERDFTVCELEIPQDFRLVTITTDDSIEPRASEIILNPQTKTFREQVSGMREFTDNVQDVIRTGTYEDASDVYFLLTTGKNALDFKDDAFRTEVGVAARIMEERMKLVSQSMMGLNIQPCNQCPTPFPTECGYIDFEGTEVVSQPYSDMIDSLDELNDDIENGNDINLDDTMTGYEILKDVGCE